MNRFKLLLLKKHFLWRIIEENEEKIEPDGWFPANKTYKHYFFNAIIHVKKGLMFHSKKYHIDKFIIWYLKENKITKL